MSHETLRGWSMLILLLSVEACALGLRDGLPDPCAPVAPPDTAGWVRHGGADGSFLLPPGYARANDVLYRHGGAAWAGPRGGRFEVVYGMWGEGSFHGRDEPHRGCTMRIGGREVRMTLTRGERGWQVVAWPREPPREGFVGHEPIFSWSGRDTADLRTFLAVLHALRFENGSD